MPVKELIFSKTAGLEPNTLEKKDFFLKCLFQGTTSRLAVYILEVAVGRV